MNDAARFIHEHQRFSRRYFLGAAAAGAVACGVAPRVAFGAAPPPELATAVENLEAYFTALDKFQDVSRGTPLPHSLPDEKKTEVGLTRETWKLEVISDKENPTSVRRPMTIQDGTALDFAGLLQLGEKHAVRFAKVMTCLNIGCPLGMGIWEGVPLREVIWRTDPRENLRRIFYYGFHNNDPEQMFQSSLPIGRVLEDMATCPQLFCVTN
jgi:DMSO/TMAO reductase YedYZ molybdopterin-dependent catalytic subunit